MNKKGEINIGQILMWLGGILILGWALLKSFGIIHSPIWVEMIPYMGAGISIVGGAYWFGKKLESINWNVKNNSKKLEKLEEANKNFIELRDEFLKVKHIQQLCINGKLKHTLLRGF